MGHSKCYHDCWMVRELALVKASLIHSWTACYHAQWQPLDEAPAQPFRLEATVAAEFSYHSGHCLTMSTTVFDSDEFIVESFECC